MSQIVDRWGNPFPPTEAFDGASRRSREMASWAPPVETTVEEDFETARKEVQARGKHLLYNNGLISSAANSRSDNLLGGQFLLSAEPNYMALDVDEDQFRAWAERTESKFNTEMASLRYWIDREGKTDFTGLMRQCVFSVFVFGEALAFFGWNDAPERPFSTTMQMIDVQRLGAGMSSYRKGVVDGVEHDESNKPVAYWISDIQQRSGARSISYKSNRYDRYLSNGRCQVMHVYDAKMPGMTRGISEMCAALKQTRAAQKFNDAYLQNAIVQAIHVATIESDLANYEAPKSNLMSMSNALSYEADRMGSVQDMYIGDGVKVHHQFTGERLNFHKSEQPGNYVDFDKSHKNNLAASLNTTYEDLTNDLSNSNYSSNVMGWMKIWELRRSERTRLYSKLGRMTYALRLEEDISAGRNNFPGMDRDQSYQFFKANEDAITECTFYGSKRPHADPLKDANAQKLMLENSMLSFDEYYRSKGQDVKAQFRKIKREREMMKEMGISMNEIIAQPSQFSGEDERVAELEAENNE